MSTELGWLLIVDDEQDFAHRTEAGRHAPAGTVARGTDDVKLATRLNEQGIVPSPLSTCGAGRPYAPGLVVGFTNIDTRKAHQAARALASAMIAAER